MVGSQKKTRGDEKLTLCTRPHHFKGFALTAVMIVIVMLTLLSGFVTILSYNQRKLVDATGGHRMKLFYMAKAGVADATMRIHTNYRAGLTPPGSFMTDAYNPSAYKLDVDLNGTNETSVDIGPANPATKRRTIISRASDV